MHFYEWIWLSIYPFTDQHSLNTKIPNLPRFKTGQTTHRLDHSISPKQLTKNNLQLIVTNKQKKNIYYRQFHNFRGFNIFVLVYKLKTSICNFYPSFLVQFLGRWYVTNDGIDHSVLQPHLLLNFVFSEIFLFFC